MSSVDDFQKIIADLEKVVGPDWNNPRARAFIAAETQLLRKALDLAVADLNYEREVNKRVLEVFKVAFGIKSNES